MADTFSAPTDTRSKTPAGWRTRVDNDDGIFNQGGKTLLLPLTKSGAGYTGTFDMGVNLA